MTVTPLGRDQDCSLKNREPDVPALLGSWILEVGARLPRLDCTSSSLESVPCPLHLLKENVHISFIYFCLPGVQQAMDKYSMSDTHVPGGQTVMPNDSEDLCQRRILFRNS
ncbi:hypothetical protein STEG23_034691, partial [Scotinomys teguina]